MFRFFKFSILFPTLLLSTNSGVASAANFQARYRADMSHLLGAGCLVANFPKITVGCVGTISLLGKEPTTVQCDPSDLGDLPPGMTSGFTCDTTPTCADSAACQQHWMSSDAEDGPFSEVQYTCEGDALADVETKVVYPNMGTETCNRSFGWNDNRSFHVSRLNVHCPAMGRDDPTDFSPDGFVNDDAFFECTSGFGFNAGLYGESTHVLTCATGRNCLQSECEVEFDNLIISSTVSKYAELCVTQLNPSATGVANGPVAPLSSGTRSASYSIGFGIFRKNEYFGTSTTADCRTVTPSTTIMIKCDHTSKINLIRSTSEYISCVQSSADTLTCTDQSVRSDEGYEMDNPVSYFDRFQYINYQCESSERYPTTTAT